MNRKLWMVGLLLAVLMAGSITVTLLLTKEPPTPTPKSLPNPNGYDTLASASKMLSPASQDFSKLSHDELAALVEANSNAVLLARSGLQQECRVPMQFTKAYLSSHLKDVAGFKGLALALSAEGRFAELENRTNDAVNAYLEIVHLGIESRRGGVLIDGLVGVAVEHIGTRNLQSFAGTPDAKACRQAAGALEKFDAGRESWNTIVETERAWSRNSQFSLQERIAGLLMSGSLKPALQKGQTKFNEQVERTRNLMIELAARAYELENGHRPTNITVLTPGYLKTIPLDPVGGTNMTLMW